jgi:hypothetical protein
MAACVRCGRIGCAEAFTGPGYSVHVFVGEISVNGKVFGEGENGPLTGAGTMPARASQPSVVVAILINLDAPVVRLGTVDR